MAVSQLPFGYVTAAAMAAASARREAVLWLPCHPGENKCVCSSYGSLSLFQSPSLCLAYPGFRGHCGQREQQDSHQMHLPQISINV